MTLVLWPLLVNLYQYKPLGAKLRHVLQQVNDFTVETLKAVLECPIHVGPCTRGVNLETSPGDDNTSCGTLDVKMHFSHSQERVNCT